MFPPPLLSSWPEAVYSPPIARQRFANYLVEDEHSQQANTVLQPTLVTRSV